jgi:hypothetical protein
MIYVYVLHPLGKLLSADNLFCACFSPHKDNT